MALDFKRYMALRPRLYHFTAESNLANIRSERKLHSAFSLDPGICKERRSTHHVVVRDRGEITIRDQRAANRSISAPGGADRGGGDGPPSR